MKQFGCINVERGQLASNAKCPTVIAAMKLNNNVPPVCGTCSAAIRREE